MGVCYSVQVDINPEPSPVVYELEVYQVYNYNIGEPEEPINYNKEPHRIYEDNF